MASAKHGTPSGYKKHRTKGEPACEPCLGAWRVVSREAIRKRRSDPAKRALDNARNKANSRALWRLAQRFPRLFQRYLKEELAKDRAPSGT